MYVTESNVRCLSTLLADCLKQKTKTNYITELHDVLMFEDYIGAYSTLNATKVGAKDKANNGYEPREMKVQYQ